MSFLTLILVLLLTPLAHAFESFSYSGRLVNSDGSPVKDEVDLTFDLAYSNTPTSVICSQQIGGVKLVNGVFHVKLDFPGCTPSINTILENIPPTHSVGIRVTDRTASPDKVYSYQAIHSVPFSFMSQMSKQLAQMGATDGQVLTWSGGQWRAITPSATPSGGITQVIGANGLNALTASGIVTVGIDTNAVDSVMIKDATIVDADISATAEIAQSKIKNLTTDLAAKEALIGTGATTDYLDGAKVWNNFDQSVRNALLLGYSSGTATPVAATDNVMEAIGKLEGQIIANDTAFDNAGQWDKDGTLLFYNSGNVGIGTSTPSDKLEVVGDISLSGKLRLKNSAISYVELKAPVGAGAVTLTLPAALGTNGQILSTDNSGNLSWLTPSTDSSQITDGSIVDADISGSANIAQSKISGLVTSLSGKQNVIALSDTTTYFRGDKTWQTLNTDAVPEGTKLYFTEPLVLGTALAGFSSGAGTISAADTILTAVNKLDGNIGAVSSAQANYVLKAGDTMTGPLGVGAPTADGHAANKLYVDTQTALSASKWTASASDIYYSSGRVAIGTNTPTGQLHLFNTSSGLTPKTEADNLVIEDATGAGLSFLTENGFSHVLDFGFRDTTNGDFEYARIEGVRPAAGLLVQRQPQLNFKFMSDGVTELVPLKIKKNMVTIDSPITLSTTNGGTIDGVKSLTHDGGGSVGMVIGGSGNVISDHNYSVIVGGSGNTISAGLGTDSSSIFGGIGSTVTGSQSIAMGLSMNVSGYRSFGIGLDYSTPAYALTQDNTMAIMGGNVGIGTTTPQGKLDIKGTLLLSGATSGYVGLSPAAVAGSTIYTLPSSDGSAGDLLKTNGAGILSWQAPQSTTPTGAAGGDLSGTYPNPSITGLAATKISDGSIDNTELGYLNGVTSNLQTQLDSKQAQITAGDIDQYWRGDKTWRDLDPDVLSAMLTGFSSVSFLQVADGDSVIGALGKLQGQINVNQTNFNNTGHWGKNSSNIYFNTGSVGIGTTTPASPLQIIGGDITVDLEKGIRSTADARLFTGPAGESWHVQSGDPAASIFIGKDAGGVTKFAFDNAGNLTVDGIIYSSVGGFRFPDGTVQTTATGGTAKYIKLGMSGYQTVDNTSIVSFDTIKANNGFTTTAGGVNLKAGHTYRLEAILNTHLSDGNGYLGYIFFDGTNAIGPSAYTDEPDSVGNYGFHSGLLEIYTPSVDTLVKVRISDDNIGGGQITPNYNTYFLVTEMVAGGISGASDNLGSHIASQNIQLGANWLSGDGGNEGLKVDGTGNVGIGTAAPTKKLEVAGGLKVTGDLVAPNCIGIDDAKASAWSNVTTSSTYQTVVSKVVTLTHSTNLVISGHGHGMVTGTGNEAMDITIFVNGAILNPAPSSPWGWGTAFVHSTQWVPVIAKDNVTLPTGTHTISLQYRSRDNVTSVSFNAAKLIIERHGCN